MRYSFYRIASFALDIAYILSPEYKLPARSKLLCDYLRMRLKAFVNRWMHFKTEHFLGFTVSFVEYHLFFETFRQVFVRQSYYFEPGTDSPTIIDCGGNAGMSVLYFKHMFPSCKIRVFEPSAEVRPILEQNISKNSLKDVEIEPYAVSNKDGKVSFYNRGPGSYGSTIVESVFDVTIQKGESTKENAETVTTKRLSPYVQGPIDLLKLDIEGAEEMVLRELREAGVLGKIKTCVLEYHYSLGTSDNKLGDILSTFERDGREYQVYLDEFMPGASMMLEKANSYYCLIRSTVKK
ncbi:MAG TPA: FkbM family methyltransferase [Candidatus Paceibacterota bacterium]